MKSQSNHNLDLNQRLSRDDQTLYLSIAFFVWKSSFVVNDRIKQKEWFCLWVVSVVDTFIQKANVLHSFDFVHDNLWLSTAIVILTHVRFWWNWRKIESSYQSLSNLPKTSCSNALMLIHLNKARFN